MKQPTIGAQLIADERQKQIDKHGFTAQHHVKNAEFYSEDQLVYAANAIAQRVDVEKYPETPKNWDEKWFRSLCDRHREERLIIAGALLAAEIDRIKEIEKNWI